LDNGNDALQLLSGELSGAVSRFLSASVSPNVAIPVHLHGIRSKPVESKEEGDIPLVEVDIGLLAGKVAESATVDPSSARRCSSIPASVFLTLHP
jgi:hypothetical protein